MTIHTEHPFADPEERRDPVRRLRGRLGGVVTLLTAGDDDGRAGLTATSVLVAPGEPAHVLALVDPEAELLEELRRTGRGVLQVLSWEHRGLADAFAGQAPAPGGPFRAADWEQTGWGPVLAGTSAWAGFALTADPEPVGWPLLVDGVVEEVRLAEDHEPLVHRRGRYLRPG